MRTTNALDTPTGASVRQYRIVEAPTRTIREAVEDIGHLRNRTGLLVGDSLDLHRSAEQLHSEALDVHLRTLANQRVREELSTLLEELSDLGFLVARHCANVAGVGACATEVATGGARDRREPQAGGHDGSVLRHRAGPVPDPARSLAG